jgi:uncharacterized membrane protein (UPF0136 family)
MYINVHTSICMYVVCSKVFMFNQTWGINIMLALILTMCTSAKVQQRRERFSVCMKFHIFLALENAYSNDNHNNRIIDIYV